MASIYKRENEDGTKAWRAVVRVQGLPSVSKSFERKEEAVDWAQETERSIKRGQFNFEAAKRKHTYSDLIERLHEDRALEHQRSFKNVRSQFDCWKKRLGRYALIHITYELIAKERQCLIDSFTSKGLEANPGTINRYMATLSSTLGYAVGQLRWIHENPCSRLLKLKESRGRDRILAERLAQAITKNRTRIEEYIKKIASSNIRNGFCVIMPTHTGAPPLTNERLDAIKNNVLQVFKNENLFGLAIQYFIPPEGSLRSSKDAVHIYFDHPD